MKVLFFLGQLEQGGAERVVSLISNKLVERGFDVEILTYYDRDINYKINKKIIIKKVVYETKSYNLLKNYSWLKSYFRNNVDVIISFMAPFNILSLFANRNNNTPIIVSDRNDPRAVPSNLFVRCIRNLFYELYANLIVVQTSANKKYFNEKVQRKTVVISNPIDVGSLANKAIKTKKKNIIISVGRLKPQKNQLMLIDAFKIFHDKHKDYQLVIYGEGSYRDVLEYRINELKLNKYVKLPGEYKNVLKKELNAKVFALSSNYEGMPNALLEAMCLGLPCISTKVSGAKEIIKNGINGYLIDSNSKDLADKLELLVNDKKLSTKLAKEASKLNNTFNIDTIANKWVTFINKVCK